MHDDELADARYEKEELHADKNADTVRRGTSCKDDERQLPCHEEVTQ